MTKINHVLLMASLLAISNSMVNAQEKDSLYANKIVQKIRGDLNTTSMVGLAFIFQSTQ